MIYLSRLADINFFMTERKSFYYGLALFLGTVFGVGIFGLPYAARQAGFWIVVGYCALFAGIVYLVHRYYAEIILATPGKHRFPGYTGYWLGGRWKAVAVITTLVGFYGTLLAYIIVGGTFLSSLIHVSQNVGVGLFFVLGSGLIFLGRKSIGKIDLVLLSILVLVVIAGSILGWGNLHLQNLSPVHLQQIMFPYGLVFFAFWGGSIIPELRDITQSRTVFMKVLLVGAVVSFCVYVFFTFFIFSITGSSTSEEGLKSLELFLGHRAVVVGYIIGCITTFTSFLSLGYVLKKIYSHDFHLSKTGSWALVCAVPLVLLFIGLHQFLGIIAFIGTIVLGIDAMLLLLMYRRYQQRRDGDRGPSLIMYITAALLAIGVASEIISSVIKLKL